MSARNRQIAHTIAVRAGAAVTGSITKHFYGITADSLMFAIMLAVVWILVLWAVEQ